MKTHDKHGNDVEAGDTVHFELHGRHHSMIVAEVRRTGGVTCVEGPTTVILPATETSRLKTGDHGKAVKEAGERDTSDPKPEHHAEHKPEPTPHVHDFQPREPHRKPAEAHRPAEHKTDAAPEPQHHTARVESPEKERAKVDATFKATDDQKKGKR